jgi:endonuclease YncB( thermonuclease family)
VRLERWLGCWAVLSGALIAPAGHAASDHGAASCGQEQVGTATVGEVLDGRTVALTDGRVVRILGIEIPLGEAGIAARTALAGLVGHAEVALKGPVASDRYGRIVAQLSVLRDGTEHAVASLLIADGHGWVAPSISGPCAADGLAAERSARRSQLGLWKDPYYEIISADSLDALSARQGEFALVEGKVVSVRESGATIYVNFGRRWSQDFTVTVLKRNERAFIDAGVDLKKLESRRIRVRGWIEQHGGPGIDALRPTQIEIVN